MSDETKIGPAHMFGQLLGMMILQLLFAFPLMFLLNYVLGPAVLTFLFGGYLTFWKTYGFLILVKYLF